MRLGTHSNRSRAKQEDKYVNIFMKGSTKSGISITARSWRRTVDERSTKWEDQ